MIRTYDDGVVECNVGDSTETELRLLSGDAATSASPYGPVRLDRPDTGPERGVLLLLGRVHALGTLGWSAGAAVVAALAIRVVLILIVLHLRPNHGLYSDGIDYETAFFLSTRLSFILGGVFLHYQSLIAFAGGATVVTGEVAVRLFQFRGFSAVACRALSGTLVFGATACYAAAYDPPAFEFTAQWSWFYVWLLATGGLTGYVVGLSERGWERVAQPALEPDV